MGDGADDMLDREIESRERGGMSWHGFEACRLYAEANACEIIKRTDVHYQVVTIGGDPIMDVWPTTGRFRLMNVPSGTKANRGDWVDVRRALRSNLEPKPTPEAEPGKSFVLTARGIDLLAGVIAKETARAVAEAFAPTQNMLAGILEAVKVRNDSPRDLPDDFSSGETITNVGAAGPVVLVNCTAEGSPDQLFDDMLTREPVIVASPQEIAGIQAAAEKIEAKPPLATKAHSYTWVVRRLAGFVTAAEAATNLARIVSGSSSAYPELPAGLTAAEISDRLTRATKLSPVEAADIAYAMVEDAAVYDAVDEADNDDGEDADPDLLETAFLVALHAVAGMISSPEAAVEKAGRIARLAVKELRQ